MFSFLGDVWWEGLTDEAPEDLIDWRGRKWTRSTAASHKNARSHADCTQLSSSTKSYSIKLNLLDTCVFVLDFILFVCPFVYFTL